jgi:hypothetical protein
LFAIGPQRPGVNLEPSRSAMRLDALPQLSSHDRLALPIDCVIDLIKYDSLLFAVSCESFESTPEGPI